MTQDDIVILKLHELLVKSEVLLHIALDNSPQACQYKFIAGEMGLLKSNRRRPISKKERADAIECVRTTLKSIFRDPSVHQLIYPEPYYYIGECPVQDPPTDIDDGLGDDLGDD